jgi:hypothetical protein
MSGTERHARLTFCAAPPPPRTGAVAYFDLINGVLAGVAEQRARHAVRRSDASHPRGT